MAISLTTKNVCIYQISPVKQCKKKNFQLPTEYEVHVPSETLSCGEGGKLEDSGSCKQIGRMTNPISS